MNFRNMLFVSQVCVHLCFFIGLFFVPWWVAILSIIISQIIFVGACGTVFFHRIVAHKNKVGSTTEKVLLLLSWIGISGSALAWAGTHRKHHRYTDTDKDPHCPVHMGIFRTYWLSSGGEDIVRYVPDLLRKPWYVFQHKYYFRVLIALHVLGIVFLPFAAYWAIFIVPAFLMWFAGSSVNVLCHKNLHSRNVWILGVLHAGEGWHDNHHNDAASASFKHKLDWGYIIYKAIS